MPHVTILGGVDDWVPIQSWTKSAPNCTQAHMARHTGQGVRWCANMLGAKTAVPAGVRMPTQCCTISPADAARLMPSAISGC